MRYLAFGILAALLLGCAAVTETRSVVSSGDIPEAKYNKIVIVVQNFGEDEHSKAEQALVHELRSAGIAGISTDDVLAKGKNFTDAQKTKLIQDNYEAVLYVRLIQSGTAERRLDDASHDGQMVTFHDHFAGFNGFLESHSTTRLGVNHIIVKQNYILKPDGAVYEKGRAIQLNSELQDTKTNKRVWVGDTSAFIKNADESTASLFQDAAQNLIKKLQADKAI
jgi:hypothetical protein